MVPGNNHHYIQIKGVHKVPPPTVAGGKTAGVATAKFKMMRPSTRQPIRTSLISSQPVSNIGVKKIGEVLK